MTRERLKSAYLRGYKAGKKLNESFDLREEDRVVRGISEWLDNYEFEEIIRKTPDVNGFGRGLKNVSDIINAELAYQVEVSKTVSDNASYIEFEEEVDKIIRKAVRQFEIEGEDAEDLVTWLFLVFRSPLQERAYHDYGIDTEVH